MAYNSLEREHALSARCAQADSPPPEARERVAENIRQRNLIAIFGRGSGERFSQPSKPSANEGGGSPADYVDSSTSRPRHARENQCFWRHQFSGVKPVRAHYVNSSHCLRLPAGLRVICLEHAGTLGHAGVGSNEDSGKVPAEALQQTIRRERQKQDHAPNRIRLSYLYPTRFDSNCQMMLDMRLRHHLRCLGHSRIHCGFQRRATVPETACMPLPQLLRKQAADEVQRIKKQQKEESDAAARTLCSEMGDE